MLSKRIKSVIPMLVSVFLITGCGTSVQEDIDGVYVYEKEGFGGEFTITLNKDGTFQYYEGGLSSSLGSGTWTLEDELLCITEENAPHPRTNYFLVEDGSLLFQAEGSDNFTFVTVLDGEQFNASES